MVTLAESTPERPDDELLADPIFIIGAPRSGTAILAHILRAHPDLAYMREPRLVWRYGNDTKSDQLDAVDARPEVVAHIRAVFAREVRAQGRRRLLEKTPSNSLRVPFIEKVFPDARYVHVIRDGADTTAAIRRRWLEPARDLRVPRQRDRLRRHLREASFSQYRHYAWEMVQKVLPHSRALGQRPWGPRLPGQKELLDDLDLLDVCTLQWRLCVERAAFFGRQLGPDRYFEIRVEDIDKAAVERIAEFCGLDDATGALVQSWEHEYDAERILERSRTFTDAELEQVTALIEPTTHWLASTSPRVPAGRNRVAAS